MVRAVLPSILSINQNCSTMYMDINCNQPDELRILNIKLHIHVLKIATGNITPYVSGIWLTFVTKKYVLFFFSYQGEQKNPKKQVSLSGKIKSVNSTHSCVILEVTPNLIFRSNLQETLDRHIQDGHVNKSHERGIGNMALQHFKIISYFVTR